MSAAWTMAGRRVAITGGAGPLGGVLSHAFAEAGAEVVILDLARANPDALAREIAARHGTACRAIACDLMEEASLRAACAELAALGPLHALVNNAAFTGTAASGGWAVPFEKQDAAIWRRALELNLTAPFLLTQALLPSLRAAGDAAVVNISSIYGLVGPDWSIYEGTPLGNPAAYAASKGGLIQLTRWMATSLAPAPRVNALALGGIERGQAEAFLREYVRRTPMRRMAREADIAGPALFLASPQSGYVTGQVLPVDGGWTAW